MTHVHRHYGYKPKVWIWGTFPETLTGDQLPPLSLSDTMSMWAAWSVQVVENSSAVRSTLLRFFPLNIILLNCLTLAVENQACWPQSYTAEVEYNTRTTQTIRLIIWLSMMNVVFQPPNTNPRELWYLPTFKRKLSEYWAFPHSYKATVVYDWLICRPQHWTHWVFTNFPVNGLAGMTVHYCCFFVILPLLLSHSDCFYADISVCVMAIMLLIASKTTGLNGWMWQHERGILLINEWIDNIDNCKKLQLVNKLFVY